MTFDFIVIGGGIAGVSAAAELARDARVLLLEAEKQLGYHATGRSAAMFIRNYGNQTLRTLNAAAEPFFIEPVGVSDRTLLSPRAELLVAREDEMDELEAYAQAATDLDRLSPAEAVSLVPILKPDLIGGAAIERGAQDIDVDRMLQGYARLFRSRGGVVETGKRVQRIERTGGSWTVSVGADQFSAPVIVNAGGAWADIVAGMAGIAAVGLTPKRRSVAVLPAPDGHDVTAWPFFASATEEWYAKPDAGRLMVSPADEDPVEPQDAWADDMVLAEGLDRYQQAVTVPVTRVVTSWAGLRTFAPDRTPVVGFEPAADGFFWLAGQGGYGVQTAPALSRLTADLCLGTSPAIGGDTVERIGPSRFRVT